MAVTIEALAEKGRTKYAAKIPSMKRGYPAARERAIAGFDATPFGTTRKAAYRDAWTIMPRMYDLKVVPGLEDKWSRNWIAKMRE